MNRDILRYQDPEIAEIVAAENRRQTDHLELIASENFVSEAVLQAMGSCLTNKYAEGTPGHRYYGGCEWVDRAEEIAAERARTILGADHANVQPHSGAQANMAVFMAILKPGDTILGMNLAHGGHLTHGSPVNFSGKLYNIVPYGVSKETGRIDMEAVRELARSSRPKLVLVGASAYSRHYDFAAFRAIADEVGAPMMVDMAHVAGLVAAGLHPNPVPFADFVTTTTHKTLRGPRGGMVLCRTAHAKAVDKSVFPGIQGGPLMHVIAAKAVCFREASQPEFKAYQGCVLENARTLASGLLSRGFDIVSGGTDNHLLCVDLRSKGITGKDLETSLNAAGITVNKNMIPFDPEKPTVTSGVRLGTPALTTRGATAAHMERIAAMIARIAADVANPAVVESVHAEAMALASELKPVA